MSLPCFLATSCVIVFGSIPNFAQACECIWKLGCVLSGCVFFLCGGFVWYLIFTSPTHQPPAAVAAQRNGSSVFLSVNWYYAVVISNVAFLSLEIWSSGYFGILATRFPCFWVILADQIIEICSVLCISQLLIIFWLSVGSWWRIWAEECHSWHLRLGCSVCSSVSFWRTKGCCTDWWREAHWCSQWWLRLLGLSMCDRYSSVYIKGILVPHYHRLSKNSGVWSPFSCLNRSCYSDCVIVNECLIEYLWVLSKC